MGYRIPGVHQVADVPVDSEPIPCVEYFRVQEEATLPRCAGLAHTSVRLLAVLEDLWHATQPWP